MHTWKNIAKNSDFTIHNIPFGIAQKEGSLIGVVSAIGDEVIVLSEINKLGLLDEIDLNERTLYSSTLNDFIAQGKTVTSAVRLRIQSLLSDVDSPLRPHSHCFIPMVDVEMVLPLHIGDYTDFYSSIEHATNVGKMFRDPANALLPNWLHLPVGYHGRSSSIVVSGTPIKRPYGQTKPDDGPPIYGPSHLLDFELEMAFVIGKNSQLGEAIRTDDAEDYIFGMMLFNDWSARDIQKWEYVPLGPFLSKNFGSTLSPWVITLEALAPFRVNGPVQDPAVLPYLQYEGAKNYDIDLTVYLNTFEGINTCISKSNFKYMYWNMCQQVAHHTVNGCNVRVGDLMASGTISGPTPDSFGSMLELSWSGQHPVALCNGDTRKFINDGDEIVIEGRCERDGISIGFGSAKGRVG